MAKIGVICIHKVVFLLINISYFSLTISAENKYLVTRTSLNKEIRFKINIPQIGVHDQMRTKTQISKIKERYQSWNFFAIRWEVKRKKQSSPKKLKNNRPVLRTHNNLVWIQVRISGSMSLTNGSGF